jgi:hypothetical protein
MPDGLDTTRWLCHDALMEATDTERIDPEPLDGFHDLLQGSATGRGAGDTAGAMGTTREVTPPLDHQYSDGVIMPGFCAWCGAFLGEHRL